jgi:bleomycin hydrolase
MVIPPFFKRQKEHRMKQMIVVLVLLVLVGGTLASAQSVRHDKAAFVDPKNEFLDSIRTAVGEFEKKEPPARKSFRLDFSTFTPPAAVSEFTKFWHSTPVSQGESGMCWAFSTISYLESEVYRQSKREMKFSVLYTVYWEYVEKARRFVQERGNSEFGEGSEANAVTRIWKKYGTVPATAYTGMKEGQKFHGHAKMFGELNAYLLSVKANNAWNEDVVLATVRSILNHYIGEPPAKVAVDGVTYTPVEFLTKVVKLNLDEYVEFLSLKEKPYYQQVEYEVGDNWWHNAQYYNIPLDDYMMILKRAIRKGYTMALGGDTSEPGYEGHAGVAIVPTFDIPSAYIDENAREFRFSNGTSTDDHGIHLVGYKEMGGVDWYLIKDSGAGSRNNSHRGYYFYHEDYVKLKILDFMVHRDVADDILKKFK